MHAAKASECMAFRLSDIWIAEDFLKLPYNSLF